MRIAQVAPLYERVPPKAYGGTERVVSYLTEELVKQGHEVTLFASGDSITSARLVPCSREALRLDRGCLDPLAHHIVQLAKVYEQARAFDVIHFHTDYLHFPMTRATGAPHVTTLHGRLDMPDLPAVYRAFREMPLISISAAQRNPLWWAGWKATVHHGLPLDLYEPRRAPGSYLAFLGRISPEKRLDRAIEIARGARIPLRVAAKVDAVDRRYFEETIHPLLDDPLVEFVGEIGEEAKGEFLGNALALLFPIDWPEPFGLVMIEAMACGTPVIAFRGGSVEEIIVPGVTGYVVDSIDGAVQAVASIGSFDRALCRASFEERFSAPRMARDYVRIYGEVIAEAEARRTAEAPAEVMA